jgi:hypothetical protein
LKGTLLHALGLWAEDTLQRYACRQQSYIKISLDLKKNLEAINTPPNSFLFTADAETMYTNILTHRALAFISDYFRTNTTMFAEVPVEALIDALRLIMMLNIFSFGDAHLKQDDVTSMGTPPSPPWATMFYALCENHFLPQFRTNITFYKRFHRPIHK